MITITKQFNLQGTAPFTYLFSSNNSQVQFSNTSGSIATNVLSNTITFPDENVLTSSTITLMVSSACGNSSVYTVNIDNPCDDFVVSAISSAEERGDLEFTVLVTNSGCISMDYQWSFDNSSYQQISLLNNANRSILRLRKLQTTTVQSQLSVTVTNPCTGCSRTRTFTIIPCTPVAAPLSINFSRDLDGNLIPVTILVPTPIGCANFEPDWTTLSANLPSGITMTNVGNQVTFTATGSFSQTNYQGQYNVTGTNNVTSTDAIITIGVQPTSGTGSTISIPDSVIYLDCDADPGDTVSIPIENITTVEGTSIDWDTFEVLNSPTPAGTVSPTIIFGLAPLGTAPIPYIQYTLPVGFTQDVFAWTVADTDGNYMTSTVFTLSECVQAPVVNDDTAVIACGDVETFDVLTNDVSSESPLNPNTVTIVTPPKVGSYVVNTTTGTITYQAPTGYAGTATIGYTVANVAGGVSDEATLTITIICAGINQRVVVCE